MQIISLPYVFLFCSSVPQDSGDYPRGNNRVEVGLEYLPPLRFDTTPQPIIPDKDSIYERPQEFEGPDARIGRRLREKFAS